MKMIQNLVFACLISAFCASHMQAGTWSSFKHFAATAPLKHPIAFITAPAVALLFSDIGVGVFKAVDSAILFASLWTLTNKQSTINPLWAYVVVPTLLTLVQGSIAYNNEANDKKELIPCKPSFKRAGGIALATLVGGSAIYAATSGFTLLATHVTTKVIDSVTEAFKARR